MTSLPARRPLRPSALLGVLGIVYGDIGTSPLYAFKATLQHFRPQPSEIDVLGGLSLIFWSLLLIVTLKYVLLVMRADNRGEGGILALMALAQRVARERWLHAALTFAGVAGACLFFGDGVITPAISVLSAVEGLEVATPSLTRFVLPISAAVIVLLFTMQFRGTATVGRVFGPIMVVWFAVLAILGAAELVQHPHVLVALSPSYGVLLCLRSPLLAFTALGSVVLVVTGAEALYADMGHFGAQPIRLVWLTYVLPSLVLNYFGQGALVLCHPAAVENPFFLLAPGWGQLPLVILATAATVIASQALISGAYSIARQCMQLGFLPRMTVTHTSAVEEGQIYVPQINWGAHDGRPAPGVRLPAQRRPRRRLRHRGHRHVPLHRGPGGDGIPPAFRLVPPAGPCRVRRAVASRRGLLRRQRAENPGWRVGAAGTRPAAARAHELVEARAGPAAAPLAAGQPAALLLPRPAPAVTDRPRPGYGDLHDRQPGLRAGGVAP